MVDFSQRAEIAEETPSVLNLKKIKVSPIEKSNIFKNVTEKEEESISWTKAQALQFVSWYIVPTIYILFSITYFTVYGK